jgi:glucoamylase
MSTTPPSVTGPSSTGPRLQYSTVTVSASQSNLTTVALYMFWLMFRNVALDGFVFEDPDPTHAGVLSAPGCILASPSWENTQTHVTQDYVYNWTRDAAVVAIELANGTLPANQPLIDYVQFAQTCQNSGNGARHFDRASFLINGAFRDGWTDQTDGPALQSLAILQLFAQLDAPTQAVANAVIAANLNFLQNAYQGKTYNLWEEEYGYSFFARAVQLKCFQEITANALGIPVPGWLANAIPWLQTALQDHWNANGGYYQSLIPAPGDKAPYDPDSDIVMAAIYGAVAVTDTKLLATAALLRNQWNLASSTDYYPINGADHQRGIGPMMGPLPRRRLRRRQRPVRDRPPLGHLHVQLRRAVLPARERDHRRQRDPARRQLGRVLQPGRSHGIQHAGRSCNRAAGRRRPDAAGDHLPQRPPRAQRAVRRQHRL